MQTTKPMNQTGKTVFSDRGDGRRPVAQDIPLVRKTRSKT